MQDLRLIQALNYNFSIKEIKYLLDQGITTNAVDSIGNSALHFAVDSSRGDASVIDLLIQHNANVLCQNNKGQTPLFLAVILDYKVIAKLLLISNISTVIIEDNLGRKPSDVAHDQELKKLLIKTEEIVRTLEDNYLYVQEKLEELGLIGEI
ncbi:hypothetical protein BA173_05350 [Rickettsia sp. MEAM1 (Bemisia tabaci)]|uniref:ankyrin repeat domain-containing protein n=1 Tax=Rickettsiales TaxID=766 RepID=UPI00082E41B8|nr:MULTISPECIES: ankyrin repeat domain-containing protein [Rickettsiales]ASX28224.1 hypothetical protein BA173_05350 [Rickettsia sp. MEAM1 (Bemisia tabaci)]ODA37058.1 hypothetical protein A8V33_00230 [Rickettsia sp. wb]ODA38310.1 hypothetical protein A8V34_01640 [Rickettsia sp. wq]